MAAVAAAVVAVVLWSWCRGGGGGIMAVAVAPWPWACMGMQACILELVSQDDLVSTLPCDKGRTSPNEDTANIDTLANPKDPIPGTHRPQKQLHSRLLAL